MTSLLPRSARPDAGEARLRRILLIISFIAGPLGLFLLSETLTDGYYARLLASFGGLSFNDPVAGLLALGRKLFTTVVWVPALYIVFGGSCLYAALTALILRPWLWWRARATRTARATP